MRRKSVPNKIRALLQQEVESKCPFCENRIVDHFEVHHIDENPENDEIENLILLCPICHSKITKGDIVLQEVIQKKSRLASNAKEGKPMPAKVINFNERVGNAVVGDNNKVTIKVSKSSKQKYPEGCIGYDIVKANYISYLMDRFHEYKEYEVGKQGMNYAIFPSHLKKAFKIGKTRTIYHTTICRFEEMAEYIQSRIDGTKLARVNKSKGKLKNYSFFDEYEALQT